MQITVYAKQRTNKEGKNFYSYLTKLKKGNEEETVAVKFREECGAPDSKLCPMNIVVKKENCNLSVQDYVDEESGEVKESKSLWVKNWKEGETFVDSSLDGYDWVD